ncbi:cyclin-B1-2-like [Pyrus ussuriensis x Pyrus communis]|uniref:Cyclin-B1-2-like n=1 Tax=Pyrus ussuriensis x Pyrus communis TaxID=2448454 RepID=A0A5N5GWE9_9ROSA|nr:cyclin-B1-2-like [Pyrus ussuriensis x Pyrus communis]
MEAPKTTKHQIVGIQNNALWFGLHNVKSDLLTQEQINTKILGYTYGSAPARPIPSSMLGLEAMTGRLDDFVRLGLSKGPISPSFM